MEVTENIKNEKGTLKSIILGTSFLLLAMLIIGCFYVELFYASQLNTGRVNSTFINDKINTANILISGNHFYKIGPLNIFTYFTQLSNLFVVIWAILYGIAILCNKEKLKIFCENPLICVGITTYVVMAGLAVAVTIVIGWTQFQNSDYFWSIMINIISIIYHFIVPICMVVYCIFQKKKEKMNYKLAYITLSFPLLYAIFTIVRGTWIHPDYYPYFIFSPKNIWSIIGGGGDYNALLSYIVIFVIMVVGTVLFYAMSLFIAYLYNKQVITDYGVNKKL